MPQISKFSRLTLQRTFCFQAKELSFCHKLWFSYPYIFAFQCRRPKIFQTMNYFRWNNDSLKYHRLTPSCCKYIAIWKSEFLVCKFIRIRKWVCGKNAVSLRNWEISHKFLAGQNIVLIEISQTLFKQWKCYHAVITRKLWNRKTIIQQYIIVFDFDSKQKKLNGSVYTAQLLCLNLIGFLQVITWLQKSSSFSRVFWLLLYTNIMSIQISNISLHIV